MSKLRVFVRQSEVKTQIKNPSCVVQDIMRVLQAIKKELGDKVAFMPCVDPLKAKSNISPQFMHPIHFNVARDRLLQSADFFIGIRTSASENMAYEMGRFAQLHPKEWQKRCFILAPHHDVAFIKTTLLRDVQVISFEVEKTATGEHLSQDVLAELTDRLMAVVFQSELAISIMQESKTIMPAKTSAFLINTKQDVYKEKMDEKGYFYYSKL